jgi:hypothetical protein
MLSLKLHMKIQVVPQKLCYLLTQPKLSQFDMHDFSPVTCELSYEVQTIQMLVIVMEHNIHLFKPKYGLILNLRHIVFNITIIKILFLHQLQVTTCTQLMPCRTK